MLGLYSEIVKLLGPDALDMSCTTILHADVDYDLAGSTALTSVMIQHEKQSSIDIKVSIQRTAH